MNFVLLQDKVIFIKRSELMPTHKGQVAFFGGHKNFDEIEPQQTAFREFEEESSISSDKLSFIGLLRPIQTSTRHSIVPVLSSLQMTIAEFGATVKSNGEWDEIYLIDFDELSKSDRWMSGTYHHTAGQTTKIVFFPFNDPTTNLLWGATGKIVFSAVNILSKIISDRSKQ